MRILHANWKVKKAHISTFYWSQPREGTEAPSHLQQGCLNAVISHSASSRTVPPLETYSQGARAEDEVSYTQFVLSQLQEDARR